MLNLVAPSVTIVGVRLIQSLPVSSGWQGAQAFMHRESWRGKLSKECVKKVTKLRLCGSQGKTLN
jgi:hypothetical protein